MADVVKYGIQIPNRVFVGGVAFDTKEEELKDFFSQYGKVKECKIIKDNQSISRGFAFVTFECKHDAIQTQQLGTVFFKQKKLNLGPAIRQKGVVFNNSAEYENEPVLSTGVYVHPSGYSYTVAPNGVWYFHNADGSPRPRQRGSPAMSYSPTLVKEIQQTTQEYQSMSSSSSSVQTTPTESSAYLSGERSMPYSYHSNMETPETPYQAPQVIENPVPVHSTSYVHHTHSTIGSSNFHVAFQNMSISSHTAAAIPPPPPLPPLPNHHVHFATTSPNMAPPSYATHAHSTFQTINSPISQSPLVPAVQYARVGDMFVPYYAPNVNSGLEGGAYESPPTISNSSCQYQAPVQPKPEYYSMMPPAGMRDTMMYPVYNPYHPTVVFPPAPCGSSPGSNISSPNTSPFSYMKNCARNGMKVHSKYAAEAPLKVDTKCS